MNDFFIKTLISLGVQLLITWSTAYTYKTTVFSRKWMYLILNVVLSFAMYYKAIDVRARYAMLVMFSIFNGIVLSYFLKRVPNESIKKNMFYTALLFLLMTSTAFGLMKYDVYMQPLVYFVSLYSIAMLGFMMYILFFDSEKKHLRTYRILSIMLFSLYVVVDTYLNMGKDYDMDLVIATLDYYFDVYGLFRNVTQTVEG